MATPQQTADTLIEQLTSALTSINDPAYRALVTGALLKSVPSMQSALREIRQGAAQEMRTGGASHADVGKALGVSRARAAQIADGKTSRARVEPDEG